MKLQEHISDFVVCFCSEKKFFDKFCYFCNELSITKTLKCYFCINSLNVQTEFPIVSLKQKIKVPQDHPWTLCELKILSSSNYKVLP